VHTLDDRLAVRREQLVPQELVHVDAPVPVRVEDHERVARGVLVAQASGFEQRAFELMRVQ
jgi:hypothetical protein